MFDIFVKAASVPRVGRMLLLFFHTKGNVLRVDARTTEFIDVVEFC